MGFLSGLFEQRDHPSNVTERILAAFGAGWETASGVDVSPESSLQVTAVLACVRRISQDVASLPLIVYRRLERGKARAQTHPIYTLLHDVANPEMTAMEFREALTGHVVLRGNGYAEIEYNNAGQPMALWPLRPDKMTPKRVSGTLAYDYQLPDSRTVRLPAWRILHLRGLSFDGLVGYNPIHQHRQAVGLAMATEEFGARFFSNAARPASVLEHPGQLSPDAHKRLRQSVEERHQGLSQAHRLMILEEGMKLHEVGLPPEDSQFLETRKFQVAEIARMFDMPPHKIGDLERATFSNIEQQDLDYVKSTLRPWLIRWEQRANLSLLSATGRRSFFVEHLVDALLRGDIGSRYEAYNIGIQSGFLTRNEVREKENLNPLDGLDDPLQPLNMVAAGEAPIQGSQASMRMAHAGMATETSTANAIEERAAQIGRERQGLAASQYGVIEDVADRVVRRETNDIGRAITKYLVRANDTQGFLLWLSGFYEEHQGFVERNFLPTFEALAVLVLASVARELDAADLKEQAAPTVKEFTGAYVATLALRHSLSNRQQLEKLLRDGVTGDDETIADVLQARLDGWSETEAGKVAMRESVRAVNATAKASYRAAGVRKLRWVASGENCPYCQDLDGKIVGIEESFVEAGDFEPDGADGPLKVRRSVGHPPVHKGCDCSIVAA